MKMMFYRHSLCMTIFIVALHYRTICDSYIWEVSRCLQYTAGGGLEIHTFHRELERALGRAHTFAYHKIGHWIMNILALVACQLDRN